MSEPTTREREIRSALTILIEDGQVVELRVLNGALHEKDWPATQYGYFDNLDLLAKEAAKWSGHAEGVYFTLNPADHRLLARAANKVKRVGKDGAATTDKQILRRRWLLIDIDHDRPTGISTTNSEHEAALTRAAEVRVWLTRRGWPAPLEADSGNGAHLLYRIDLSNDDASRNLVQRCLEALAWHFDDSVKIDRSVFNAGRICKLYGTLAAKGDSTADRPHRIARLLHVPGDLQIVGQPLLIALAASVPQLEATSRGSQGRDQQVGAIDIANFIQRHGIRVLKEGGWQTGRRWVIECPWDGAHTNQSAYIVQFGNGAIAAGCHHNSCQGKGWRDLRELYERPVASSTTSCKEDEEASKQDDQAGRAKPSDESESPDRKGRPSQASRLVAVALDAGLVLCHTEELIAFVRIPVDEHGETWSIRGKGFKHWLIRRFFSETSTVPNSQALAEALNVLEAKAIHDSEQRPVYLRLARHDDAIYLDLVNQTWQAVKITASGWEVVNNPPVSFCRRPGLQALPIPRPDGQLDELWRFVNVVDRDHRTLLLAYLVAMFRPEGPYPILILSAEQGSAKSTLAKMIRCLVDPSLLQLRAEPRNIQDLMIAASNSWLLAFDNLSQMPPWLSDALCRLSTGGGLGTRELYSDKEETLFNAQRPVVLTSIEDIASRSDLLDRAVVLPLPPIPEERRRSESELWAEFREAQPRLLGCLLSAVATALHRFDQVRLPRLPRMADYAIWSTAAEPGLGLAPGAFMAAYSGNIEDASSLALEAEPVAAKLLGFMQERESWRGTASQLLEVLTSLLTDTERRTENWPKRADKLSGRLMRVAPNLRKVGIDVQKSKAHRPRTLTVSKTAPTSVPSVPGVPTQAANPSHGTPHPEDRDAITRAGDTMVAAGAASWGHGDARDAGSRSNSGTVGQPALVHDCAEAQSEDTCGSLPNAPKDEINRQVRWQRLAAIIDSDE